MRERVLDAVLAREENVARGECTERRMPREGNALPLGGYLCRSEGALTARIEVFEAL
jgi:hypothetical protein